jgi:branched-chain amino acid transport system substrate-binding protein
MKGGTTKIFGVVAILMTACLVGSLYAAEKTVTVGLLAPLTGSSAGYGQSQREGTILAVEEWNSRGGIKGVGKIKLIEADDEGNPAVSVNGNNKLIYRDKVVSVLGAADSSCTLASMKVAQKAQIPQVTGISSNPMVTGQGNKWIFRNAPTDAIQASTAAKFVINKLGKRKIALLNVNDDYGVGAATVFEKTAGSLGVKMLAHEMYNRKDVDFTGQLNAINNAKPEVVAVYGLFGELSIAIKQAKQLGMDNLWIGGTGIADTRFIELGGKHVEDVYVTLGFTPHSPDLKVKSFVSKYEQRWGRVPPTHAAQAYDAANLLFDAIRRAGTTNNKKLRAALLNSKWEGLCGTISFDETGNDLKPCVVTQIKDGKYVALK